MGTTAEQIEAHIDETREALGSNLDELEQKVRAAADWKHHFQTRPGAWLGIAFGGGVVLAAILGRRPGGSEKPLLSKPGAGANSGPESARREEVVARQTWDNVKGALIAVATTRLLSFASNAFLGPHGKNDDIETASSAVSPARE